MSTRTVLMAIAQGDKKVIVNACGSFFEVKELQLKPNPEHINYGLELPVSDRGDYDEKESRTFDNEDKAFEYAFSLLNTSGIF
jgi:hypothetical protein